MKNRVPDRTVVIDGIEYDIVFASEVSDDQRLEMDLPARGTRCSCKDCVCENKADAGTVEHPYCGCCLADCPDVHPEHDGCSDGSDDGLPTALFVNVVFP